MIVTRLSKLALTVLKDMDLKKKIADTCGVSVNTVYAWIKTDSNNLTKADVVKVIKQETGLTEEQILSERVLA